MINNEFHSHFGWFWHVNKCLYSSKWSKLTVCRNMPTVTVPKLTLFPVIFWFYSNFVQLKFRRFFRYFERTYGAWWDAELLIVTRGSKLCAPFLNIKKNSKKRFGTVPVRFPLFLFNLLILITVFLLFF